MHGEWDSDDTGDLICFCGAIVAPLAIAFYYLVTMGG